MIASRASTSNLTNKLSSSLPQSGGMFTCTFTNISPGGKLGSRCLPFPATRIRIPSLTPAGIRTITSPSVGVCKLKLVPVYASCNVIFRLTMLSGFLLGRIRCPNILPNMSSKPPGISPCPKLNCGCGLSYAYFFSGSLRVSYASCIFLNFSWSPPLSG